LRGSQSFTVLIDGRPSVLDAQDALQQIAATSIEKIELITNPSAKYDPEGTAGIINIILKKNTNLGLNGIVNANAGMHESYGGDFLINYQADRIKTNLGFDYNRRYIPSILHRIISTSLEIIRQQLTPLEILTGEG
jgi:outer membrane cobalamin receptor